MRKLACSTDFGACAVNNQLLIVRAKLGICAVNPRLKKFVCFGWTRVMSNSGLPTRFSAASVPFSCL